ncbi:hypothetical protein [Parvibaculum sp.]|uniref:hypothetical protein n=1 Tax=Parvibaculum sp. TaxID=2024848 RepID=UPI001B070318|nr:hypothetical protein [Parvibaculum sp.]MBO6635617.1 hypothetical protein [Parvibaculum sp.]MBO6678258.1 hypothetical protein [Parvibaculum sp.]MBO6686735.1 hypothetical protein [Parvibaculum sp.]MBO6903849.1 hypothetical protein [Parvibaculum sp.]
MNRLSRRLAARALMSALIGSALVATSVSAEAVNDEIRVQAMNSSFFTISHIRLENVDTGKDDKNKKNYHGRGDLTRRVKMKVSDGEDITESYKFFVDPLGGLSGDSGEKICLAFDVSSRNGKVYSVLPTGPWDTQGVKREQLWNSEKSNPQIITIALEVEGDLNDMLCRISYVRRRQND